MKHVTTADKSFLIGDAAADLLVDYAAAVGSADTADRVDLRAVAADGSETVATFLLNSGTILTAETSVSTLPEPDNAEAERSLHARLRHLTERRTASPEEIAGVTTWNRSGAA